MYVVFYLCCFSLQMCILLFLEPGKKDEASSTQTPWGHQWTEAVIWGTCTITWNWRRGWPICVRWQWHSCCGQPCSQIFPILVLVEIKVNNSKFYCTWIQLLVFLLFYILYFILVFNVYKWTENWSLIIRGNQACWCVCWNRHPRAGHTNNRRAQLCVRRPNHSGVTRSALGEIWRRAGCVRHGSGINSGVVISTARLELLFPLLFPLLSKCDKI